MQSSESKTMVSMRGGVTVTVVVETTIFPQTRIIQEEYWRFNVTKIKEIVTKFCKARKKHANFKKSTNENKVI